MNRLLAPLVAVVSLCPATALAAEPPQVTLAARIWQSDLVVVGKVLSLEEPSVRTMSLPPDGRPTKTTYRECIVEVAEVIHWADPSIKPAPPARDVESVESPAGRDPADAANKPPAKGDKVSVWYQAEPLSDAAPGARTIGDLEMTVSAGGGPVPYVRLEKAKSYLLCLRRVGGGMGYFAVMLPVSYQPADPAALAAARKAADPNSLPWGKAVHGLQLATIPWQDKFEQSMLVIESIVVESGSRRMPCRAKAPISALLAVRNCSAKPIDLRPAYVMMGLRATVTANGRSWAQAVPLPPVGDARKDLKPELWTLPPGAVAILDTRPATVAVEAPIGKAKLQFIADVKPTRDGRGDEDVQPTAAWSGKIESGSAEIEIVDMVPRPM